MRFHFRVLATASALAVGVADGACAQDTGQTALPLVALADVATNLSETPKGNPTSTTSTSEAAIVVTARRLDRAREALLPSLGANRYTLDAEALTLQPQGLDRSFRDVLLQTPGTSLDQFGQVHIRNEHANLQYRINGIIVPEPVTGFASIIDTRIANSVSLITGALPAQYGYRTAGVVDILTDTGSFKDTATASFYGGDYHLIQPAIAAQGSVGGLSAYGSATLTRSDIGIENSTASKQTFHDHTDQTRAFGYVSQILSDTTRITGIFGFYEGRFEVPDTPGADCPDPTGARTCFAVNGRTAFAGTALNQRQRENAYYGTVALQYSNGDVDVQLAPFVRLSRTRFYPDQVGDLTFNGVADQSRLSSDVTGVQVDGRWKIAGAHTLRGGLFFQNEITHSAVSSLVFDTSGTLAPDQPFTLFSGGRKRGNLYSVYLQDEWNPLPPLTINFGGRFDRVEAFTHEQQFSPRANAVFKFSDQLAVHVGYMRTFTPPPQELVGTPDLLQTANTTKAPPATFQNDPVRAEREHYLDSGLSYSPLHGLNLTVDGYYKWKRHLLDEGQFGEALVLAPFNYQTGYNYGVEFGGSYTRHLFRVYGDAAYGRERGTQFISSQYFFPQDKIDYVSSHYVYVDHNQTWTASGGGSYGIPNAAGVFTPSFDFIYGSGLRRDGTAADGSVIPNGAHLPSYTSVNASLEQAFNGGLGKGWKIRFDVVNLLDKVYAIRDGTGIGLSARSYGQRRSFFGGVSKTF